MALLWARAGLDVAAGEMTAAARVINNPGIRFMAGSFL
jgi:hypothetical protein